MSHLWIHLKIVDMKKTSSVGENIDNSSIREEMDEENPKKSFIEMYFVDCCILVAVTVIITVSVASLEVIGNLFSAVYVPIIFLAVGLISLAVVILVKKLQKIRGVNPVLILLTVFSWSFAAASLTKSLGLWTLLAWSAAIILAVSAVILGYVTERLTENVYMIIFYVAMLLAVIGGILFIFLHFFKRNIRDLAFGEFLATSLILILYLTGQTIQQYTKTEMISKISLWAAFISWVEVVLLYFSLSLVGGVHSNMNATEANNILKQIFEYAASIVMENDYVSDVYLNAASIAIVICLLLLTLLLINKRFKFLPRPIVYALIALMVLLWVTAYSLLCCNDNPVELNTFLGVSIAVHAIVGFVATYVGKLGVANCVTLMIVAIVAFIGGAVFSTLHYIDHLFEYMAAICWGGTSAIILFVVVNRIHWSKKK
ncbi:unnamed protein product [Trichobilharzia szidati]|nr:unnamed protein product [Trichobilharzia szidati]